VNLQGQIQCATSETMNAGPEKATESTKIVHKSTSTVFAKTAEACRGGSLKCQLMKMNSRKMNRLCQLTYPQIIHKKAESREHVRTRIIQPFHHLAVRTRGPVKTT